jgi:hypothetical protein
MNSDTRTIEGRGGNHGARNRAQASNHVARRLNEALENDAHNGPGCVQIGNYVVTYGTGEGEFAYHVVDVERFLRSFEPVAREDREDGSDEPYSAFCRACTPVASRRIAFRMAREGYRIAEDGSGRRILTDAEWARVRA